MSGADHLKRLALQLAAQLPESDSEAFYVLDLTRGLVEHLSSEDARKPANLLVVPPGRILRLVPAGAAVDLSGPPDRPSRG